MAGMDPLHFLNSTDEFEVLVMQKVAREYLDGLRKLDEMRANMIANEVWRRVK